MAFSEIYRKQVALLIRVLPLVAAEKSFALKGGTAINLFIRDMPRLSVDIDLTYLPVEPRPKSLKAIDAAMGRIAASIRKVIQGARVTEARPEPDKIITRLVVRADGAQIKIEVTPVLRGCVYEPELRTVSPVVQDAFGFAETLVVSFADLYAGKIVAALDRQHPRDLFDVRYLLANEGIDDSLRCAFLVYMLSHHRPMAEVLAPPRKKLEGEFVQNFDGMTAEHLSVEALAKARENLIEEIVGRMPEDHRRFLISFERGEPIWELLGIPEAAELPAVKWRQQNLDKISVKKRGELVAQLEQVLSD